MQRRLIALYTFALAVGPTLARADGPVAIHSPPELAGGVVLTTLGGASLLAGSVLVVTGAAFDCNFICVIDRKTSFDAGIPLLIGGIVVTGAGVWLDIHGGRREPQHWAVAPILTPRSASLAFAASF